MSNAVKILRLVTGEDLVVEVLSETDVHYVVKQPVQVHLSPGTDPQTGQMKPQLSVIPWFFMLYTQMAKDAKTGIKIRKQDVMFSPDAPDDIKAEYTALFSPIAVTKPQLIIPG